MRAPVSEDEAERLEALRAYTPDGDDVPSAARAGSGRHVRRPAGTREPDRLLVIYKSPQLEEITGYTQDEWLADPELWFKLVHPEDRERVRAESERCLANGELYAEEYRLVAKDGRVVWVHDTAKAVPGPDGRPALWQGVLVDVTEKKRTEEERDRAFAQLESLYAAGPVGLAFIDLDLRFVRVNELLAEINGEGVSPSRPSRFSRLRSASHDLSEGHRIVAGVHGAERGRGSRTALARGASPRGPRAARRRLGRRGREREPLRGGVPPPSARRRVPARRRSRRPSLRRTAGSAAGSARRPTSPSEDAPKSRSHRRAWRRGARGSRRCGGARAVTLA